MMRVIPLLTLFADWSAAGVSNGTSSAPKCIWKELRDCGADDPHPLFTSTCKKNTDWNYVGVSKELKRWVRSVDVDPVEMPRDVAVSFHDESAEEPPFLDFVGRVNARGFAVGNFWTSGGYSDGSAFNNGFLFGPLDERGEMSGDKIVFLYPDLKTVLVGNFSSNVMVSAKPSRVVAERCQGGIKQIRVARPKPDAPTFRHFQGTTIRVSGLDPTLPDPYERRMVYIARIPGIGEGMFAKRNILAGMSFTYYGGLVYNITENPIYTNNLTNLDYERIHKNVITLTDDLWMNLPYELWNLEKFRASLAHKMNHSFKKANCQFVSIYNPRFGMVRGCEATRNIRKGEQIFVEYGYPIEDLYPPWYVDLYLHEMGPLPKDALKNKDEYDGDDDSSSSDASVSSSSKSSSSDDIFADESEVDSARRRAERAKEIEAERIRKLEERKMRRQEEEEQGSQQR